MNVKPCNSYAARPAGTALHRSGRSVFKIYYADIYGREQPERYEWDRAAHRRETVTTALDQLGVEGVGFVVAFPHVAKAFRWSPEAETLLLVRAFRPADGSPLSLDRGERYMEFACLAEAVIAAQEYRLWATAPTVEAWLDQWVVWPDLPIVDHTKLGRYWT